MSLLRDLSRLLGSRNEEGQAKYQEDLLTSLLVNAWMVEARDPHTGGHLWRVSRFSRLLVTDAGLSGTDVARSWFHVVLNYLIPYLVSSYSAARNELNRVEG